MGHLNLDPQLPDHEARLRQLEEAQTELKVAQANQSGKIDQANQILGATEHIHSSALATVKWVITVSFSIVTITLGFLGWFGLKSWEDAKNNLVEKITEKVEVKKKEIIESMEQTLADTVKMGRDTQTALSLLREDPEATRPETRVVVERVAGPLGDKKDKTAEEHLILGVAAYNRKDLDTAETEWRRSIELDPKYAAAHSNLGVLLAEMGRTEEAEAAYHRATELDPKLATVPYNLGNLLKETGRNEEAVAAYRRAI